ncbi:hypothetical protein L3X38_025427 [Prunus dulcis]|uniref:Uncharacterized protein n=1 Tax=Prunus dulcis TaxID=3755 RepID=A0AAD4W1L5_PRUDU|nr:hypothetical protein L3X38_025427 [Prunus dulcis]
MVFKPTARVPPSCLKTVCYFDDAPRVSGMPEPCVVRIHEDFWELTGFGVVGTPKLSELGARAIPGWVTHWEVARELPETKPCGQRGGPKADNIVLRRSRSRDVTRIVAQIEVLSLRPARTAAQIEVLSLRPTKNAARLTLWFRDLQGWN